MTDPTLREMCADPQFRDAAICQRLRLSDAYRELWAVLLREHPLFRLCRWINAWLDAQLAGTWFARPIPRLDRGIRLLSNGLIAFWFIVGLAATIYLIIQHFW